MDGRPIKFFRDSFKAAAKKIGATGTLPHACGDLRSETSGAQIIGARGHGAVGASDKLDLVALLDHQRRRSDREYEARVEEQLKLEKQNRKVAPINQRSA